MTIEVFYLAGCPNHRAAIERIENVLRTEHLSGKLVQIEFAIPTRLRVWGSRGPPPFE